MSGNKEFKIKIMNKLLSIDSARLVSDTLINMRCQFCGDSSRDKNKRRLYIKIDVNDGNLPILYYCHNCHAKGVLNPSVLRTFKINDMDLNSSLLSYNSKITNKEKSLYNRYNNFKFNVPVPKATKNNLLKKRYIENRLGLHISTDELIKFKTIFSLQQFIEENTIDELTVKEYMGKLINTEYVGFLTSNNEFINFRDITNKNKMRYFKYSIVPNLMNTLKFFTIPSSLDLMSTDVININIAEGVFDILGVYYHVLDQNTNNNIYAAVCGCEYTNVIKHFLKMGIVGNNVFINIFSDSDKAPSFYRYLIKEISPWVATINLFYNSMGKDFGVPKSEINVVKNNYVDKYNNHKYGKEKRP